MNKLGLGLLCLGLIFWPIQGVAQTDVGPLMPTGENETQKESRLPAWLEKFSFSGLIETQARYEETKLEDAEESKNQDSRLKLKTVELGVDLDIVSHVSGHVLLKYEQDEDLVVDEGYILLDGEERLPLYLKAGEFYLPFGSYESGLISDPLTLELGESREGALEVGVEAAGFYGRAYLFNADSKAENFGAAVGYGLETGNFSLNVGTGYIHSLMASAGWRDVIDEKMQDDSGADNEISLDNRVGGFNVFVAFELGPITLQGEYVTALNHPKWRVLNLETDLFTMEEDRKPAAWHAEAGFGFDLAGKAAMLAVSYQGTQNVEDVFPEKRYAGAFSLDIFNQTTLALEYCHDKFKSGDTVDSLTAQLTITF